MGMSILRALLLFGFSAVAILLSLPTSVCQLGIFFVVIWRRVCFVKWSLRMKRRSHTGQANFFSPVWVLRWRDSSSERANFLSQPSQLQLKGFSPAGHKRGITYFWEAVLQFYQRTNLNPALQKLMNSTQPLMCAVNISLSSRCVPQKNHRYHFYLFPLISLNVI